MRGPWGCAPRALESLFGRTVVLETGSVRSCGSLLAVSLEHSHDGVRPVLVVAEESGIGHWQVVSSLLIGSDAQRKVADLVSRIDEGLAVAARRIGYDSGDVIEPAVPSP